MCSAPSAPKTPKYEPVDQYQAYKQHTRYDDYRAAGGRKIEEDGDVRYFNEWLLQDTFDTEFNDATFLDAFNELARSGQLSGAKHLDENSREAQQFRSEYEKEVGTYEGWEGAYAYTYFDYSDDTDLQRVYDQQFAMEQDVIRQESSDQLAEQFAQSQQMQIEAQEAAAAQQAEMMQYMSDQQAESMAAQQEMMEEMMNQPMYSPQQAALPKVQYKPKEAKPMPAQPAPAPSMNITPAPAPELVNTGNQMGIVKQSSTARTRSRMRTRGTSILT